jgi:hypothetical protein
MDPHQSTYTPGTIGIGSGNVGYTETGQWRNLIFISLTSSGVTAMEDAYRVELQLDPSGVNGAPDAPDWRVDYLGVVSEDANLATSWNTSFFSWEMTPGYPVGVLETDGLMINRTFDVSDALAGLSVSSYPAYLLFRVSSLAPPELGVQYSGSISEDLGRHKLMIYTPDAEPEWVHAGDRIHLNEGSSTTWPVCLKGKPSGNVRLNVELPADSWLEVAPQTMVFTPDNWNVPQELTLNGNGDDRYAFLKTSMTLAVDPSESPATWAGVEAGLVTVLRKDNDPLNLGVLAGRETISTVLEISTEEASVATNAAAQHSPVWTHEGNIYHVYVNHLQQAVVAKYPEGGPPTTHVLMEGVENDPHYSFSLGLDSDGYIHVCGNMHNGRPGDGLWNYWISQAPGDLTTWHYYADPAWENWPDATETSSPGPILTGNTISYVLFRPDNGGRLFASFRGRALNFFGKGWTGLRLSRLDGAAGDRWEPLGVYTQSIFSDDFFPARVIAWDDVGGREEGGWYQTYRGQIWFDAQNRLHLCWAYFGANSRTHTTSPPSDYGSGATHILYARSPDGGLTWERADGTPIVPPLNPLNADVVIETNPGDLTSTAYVVATAEGNPVVSFSRNGLPMTGDPYLKAWLPGFGWSEARALPTQYAFQILADRRGILTLPDSDGTWHRSYDGGESWNTIPGAPFYSGGEAASVDYPHLQATGEVRFHTLYNDEGTYRYGIWTVAFSPEETPSHAESWRESWFGDPSETGNGAENMDPDQDGMANWIERALGGNPLVSDRTPTVSHTLSQQGSAFLEFSYSRIEGGAEVGNGCYRFAEIEYQLQESTELLQWDSRDDWLLQSVSTGPGTGWEAVRFRLPEPIVPDQPRFIRLRLQKVP